MDLKHLFFGTFALTLPFLAIVGQAAEATHAVEGADAGFEKVVLARDTADPMELAVAPDGRVIFIERIGAIKIWKPETKTTVVAGQLPVFYHRNGEKKVSWEDGLIGVTLDPNFSRNHWIYLYPLTHQH